jgi:hypothetical protein
MYSCEATIELSEFNTYSIYSSKNYLLKLNLNNTLYPQFSSLTLDGNVVRTTNNEINLRLECKFHSYEKIEWFFNDTLKNSSL